MAANHPLTFLIIEDNTLSSQLIVNQLEGLGHHVVGQAFNKPEGVALTKALAPDVILMDLQMTDPETGEDDPRAGIGEY